MIHGLHHYPCHPSFLLQGKDGPAGGFGPQGDKGDKVRCHVRAEYGYRVWSVIMLDFVSVHAGS